MFNTMPRINLNNIEHLSDEAREIVLAITKRDGSIYSSKPVNATGLEKYIWRHVVFTVSPKNQHHSFPVTADFDLYDWLEENYNDVLTRYEFRKLNEIDKKYYHTAYNKAKELKDWIREIEDEIINLIPKDQWHGINRWGKALGKI